MTLNEVLYINRTDIAEMIRQLCVQGADQMDICPQLGIMYAYGCAATMKAWGDSVSNDQRSLLVAQIFVLDLFANDHVSDVLMEAILPTLAESATRNRPLGDSLLILEQWLSNPAGQKAKAEHREYQRVFEVLEYARSQFHRLAAA